MGQLVMVVDDSELNLRVASNILKDDFDVACANSGEKAFELMEKRIPDLMLLDLHMPGMNGFEVMEKMNEDPDLKHIPVIMLTADNNRENEVRGFELGAMDFIAKPFVDQIMLHRVGRILELSRLQKFLKREVAEQTEVAEERRRQVE
jgi:putative two-component system response regulator